MPYVRKGAQTEIGKKIEMLAEKLPYKEWYLPDPYNPASYVMPIGGLTLSKAKSLRNLAQQITKGKANIPSELKITLPHPLEEIIDTTTLRGQQSAVRFLRSLGTEDKPYAETLHQIDFLIEALKRGKK